MIKLIITAVFLLLQQTSVSATTYDAVYIRTLDADTHEFSITVWPQLSVTTNIRLHGIDTPETTWRANPLCRLSENEHGKKATAYAKELLEKSLFVRVKDVSLGKFAGRVLGTVVLAGGESLAQKLTDKGYAVPYFGGKKPDWCDILK